MKRMSAATRCKLQRIWLYTRLSSLGVFMIFFGICTGWFARDVFAVYERKDMRADFNAQLAAINSGNVEEIQRISERDALLLREKDIRIQELSAQLLVLADKQGDLVDKTSDAARDAQRAATKADQALRNAPRSAPKEGAATKRAVEEANERIKRAGDY